jgi:hypothetical protein
MNKFIQLFKIIFKKKSMDEEVEIETEFGEEEQYIENEIETSINDFEFKDEYNINLKPGQSVYFISGGFIRSGYVNSIRPVGPLNDYKNKINSSDKDIPNHDIELSIRIPGMDGSFYLRRTDIFTNISNLYEYYNNIICDLDGE